MPSRHKNPAVVCRPTPELHRRAKNAVTEVDSDINAHIIAFLHWLVGDTDELPNRPPVANEHRLHEAGSLG
ncbi:hypothetical protein ACFVW8_21225 [Streptomyces sp. NPDC058221]|uniref:hypothetical protein n=1 Tax=Streptomyces sp. NPDC058221 TaxID=3346388 RepID=UPI0036E1693D